MSSDAWRRYQDAMDAERKAFRMLHEAPTGTLKHEQLWEAWQRTVLETDEARSALLTGLGRHPPEGIKR